MPIAVLVVIGVLALALAAFLLVPLRFELSAEARAEPDGQWLAAAGLACGPLAVSGVGGRGVPATLHVYVFGKRRYSEALAEPPGGGADEEGAPEQTEPPARPGRLRRWMKRKVDPIDAVAWLIAERRRVRFGLDVAVAYSFRDVAFTGKVLASVYVLLPLLPRGIRLRQTPSWETVDQGTLQASGSVRIFAGLVLCDLIWYMLRRGLSARRRQRRETASQPWPKPKSSTS